jgi:hypothetical protein
MSQHLSSREFVEALDGALGPSRLEHAQACATCRGDLGELQRIMRDVGAAADRGEPSPLFWEHFSARVSQATSAEAIPAAHAWRRWTFAAVAGGLAAVVLAVLPSLRAPAGSGLSTASDVVLSGTLAPGGGDSDQSWQAMLHVAADLPADELSRMVAPMPGAADAVAADLTPAQQRELISLLQAEIGAVR